MRVSAQRLPNNRQSGGGIVMPLSEEYVSNVLKSVIKNGNTRIIDTSLLRFDLPLSFHFTQVFSNDLEKINKRYDDWQVSDENFDNTYPVFVNSIYSFTGLTYKDCVYLSQSAPERIWTGLYFNTKVPMKFLIDEHFIDKIQDKDIKKDAESDRLTNIRNRMDEVADYFRQKLKEITPEMDYLSNEMILKISGVYEY